MNVVEPTVTVVPTVGTNAVAPEPVVACESTADVMPLK